jgi:tryptophanyl-tRNA synthetase
MGLLERCHSYKDKIANGISPSHGLFAYPVLMAADILIYDATSCRSGKRPEAARRGHPRHRAEDEPGLRRGPAQVPEPRIREETAVVPGLDGRKMSKSYDNTIQLFEEPGALKKKIMRIVMDSTPLEAPKPIEGSSVLALYKLVASTADYQTMVDDHLRGGIGYGDFKKRLLEAMLPTSPPSANAAPKSSPTRPTWTACSPKVPKKPVSSPARPSPAFAPPSASATDPQPRL